MDVSQLCEYSERGLSSREKTGFFSRYSAGSRRPGSLIGFSAILLPGQRAAEGAVFVIISYRSECGMAGGFAHPLSSQGALSDIHRRDLLADASSCAHSLLAVAVGARS